jgi:hypothetical protein
MPFVPNTVKRPDHQVAIDLDPLVASEPVVFMDVVKRQRPPNSAMSLPA